MLVRRMIGQAAPEERGYHIPPPRLGYKSALEGLYWLAFCEPHLEMSARKSAHDANAAMMSSLYLI